MQYSEQQADLQISLVFNADPIENQAFLTSIYQSLGNQCLASCGILPDHFSLG